MLPRVLPPSFSLGFTAVAVLLAGPEAGAAAAVG